MWLYNIIINNMLIIISVGFILKIHSQEIGEKCRLKENHDHSEGICKLHSDCRGIENYAKKMIPITLCGFHHLTVPIVCCKNDRRISGSIIFPFEDEEEETFIEQENNNKDESTIISSRKSEEMCNQFTKVVIDTVHAIPLITDVKPISINVTKCEYNSVALIVGGTPALIGEFPFMVAVGFPNSENYPEWRCGGTLISDKWVLTAAHCTFSRDGAPKWLRFGALNLNRRYESGRVDYFIDRIIVHPKYKYPLKYNDIALLSTSEPVEFSNLIRPACLNTNFNVKQKVALAVGWGQTDYSGPNSEKLLKVQLNIYNNNVCNNAYHQDINGNSQISKGILSSMLCAGELKGGRDTCLGDSGGPLFITETNNRCKFFIIGVTSFGKLCGQENVPAVYTRVSEYVPWIESIIW